MQKGKIGVTTENIFPIIKKFLYSDHEIFLRELISNAVDATTKLKTLAARDEFRGETGDLTIKVSLDETARTLTISDRGIGMSAEEVERYINQIAFSGAEEFMAKYEGQNGIIGHFGLGFYSAFMVASKVELLTRSYREEESAVRWACDGTPEYTLEPAEKEGRGTDITLHIADDSAEFATKARIGELLRKYCRFLPVPIEFDGAIINDTTPLWTRKPADIAAPEYDEFYQKLYPLADEPLFHIHLNVDYPFNLTGILYFPRLRNNIEVQKNKIQLYSNQVFVTDSVEGIVPEFLTLLHGVIDSPDIPLNVSRSYLQSDANVRKISGYITKKVADRLAELFKNSRPEYEEKWDDLKVFIQYGIVSEEKFGERAGEFTLLKNSEDKYFTFDEYETRIKSDQTDRHGKLVFLYSNDPVTQHTPISQARKRGYDILVMDSPLDGHFIALLESRHPEWRFVRVDSDTLENLIEKEDKEAMALTTDQQRLLTPVFEAHLPSPEESKALFRVQFEAMSPSAAPVVVTQGEFMRRMKEMARIGGTGMNFYGEMPDSYNLVVNGNHPLIVEILGETETVAGESLEPLDKQLTAAEHERHALAELIKDKKEEELSTEERTQRDTLASRIEELERERRNILSDAGKRSVTAGQLVDLALLSGGMLKGEALSRFIDRSVEVIGEALPNKSSATAKREKPMLPEESKARKGKEALVKTEAAQEKTNGSTAKKKK